MQVFIQLPLSVLLAGLDVLSLRLRHSRYASGSFCLARFCPCLALGSALRGRKFLAGRCHTRGQSLVPLFCDGFEKFFGLVVVDAEFGSDLISGWDFAGPGGSNDF